MFRSKTVELVGAIGLADPLNYVLEEARHGAHRKSPTRKQCVRLNDRSAILVELEDWVIQLGNYLGPTQSTATAA